MMRASQTCHVEVGRGTKAELTSAQILSLLEILIATLLELQSFGILISQQRFLSILQVHLPFCLLAGSLAAFSQETWWS